MKYFVGLDLGTTTVKAVVYDESGKPVNSASVERILLTPRAGYCEQDALGWVEDSCAVIREAVKNINAADVAGLSISSQGITTVATDESFNPLYNAINWMDVRDVDAWKPFLQRCGIDYARKVTGFPLKETMPKGCAKIMWIRDNQPEIYKKARYFLMPAGFVTAHFTGAVLTDSTMASGTMLFNNFSGGYDKKLLECAEIPEELLAPIVPAGTAAGYLKKQIAEKCGLTEKCIVAVGGQDQKVAAYGIGVKENEIACSFGTSAALEIIASSCDFEIKNDMFKVCPYMSGYCFEAVIKTACGAIRWVRDTICGGLDFTQMDKEAMTAPYDCNGAMFVPYLGGSPDGKRFGSFNNINLSNTRGDLIRAVTNGVAFECARLVREAGINSSCIGIYSGGSKSRLLCQTLADALNMRVLACNHSEMGAFGAARLAAEAVGVNTCGCALSYTEYVPENAKEAQKLLNEYIELVR